MKYRLISPPELSHHAELPSEAVIIPFSASETGAYRQSILLYCRPKSIIIAMPGRLNGQIMDTRLAPKGFRTLTNSGIHEPANAGY